MLTIEFQTIETPIAQEAFNKVGGVFGGVRIHGREVEAIPPRNILGNPLAGKEFHLGVLAEYFGAWVGSNRCPP
jgi:hypothetical protein